MEIIHEDGLKNIGNFSSCILITPVHQWVEIASLFLEGKAEVWFEGFLVGDHDLTNWEGFVRCLCNRLRSREHVAEEFNKLVHDKGMEEYIKRFEELKSLISTSNSSLPVSYYISSFIGLKEDIKPTLKILKSGTLVQELD